MGVALRAPVALRHLVVAGGQRKRYIGGNRKRGHAQRRYFTQPLEILWRRDPHSPFRIPAPAAARSEANASSQPPPLENASFEEYYKVGLLLAQPYVARRFQFLSILSGAFRSASECDCVRGVEIRATFWLLQWW